MISLTELVANLELLTEQLTKASSPKHKYKIVLWIHQVENMIAELQSRLVG